MRTISQPTVDQAQRLREGRVDVLGQRGGHRLDADRVVAAHGHVADHDHAGLAPAVGIYIRHVGQFYRAADRVHIQCCIQYIIPCGLKPTYFSSLYFEPVIMFPIYYTLQQALKANRRSLKPIFASCSHIRREHTTALDNGPRLM